ncbi:hypothetical protein JF50_13270 [Pseudoalteromonas luteoviolacea]|uniref:Histidine kinase/HSP90-like ATPase domain-containing protein n=1 Tax=Pseudoalteromonas luteoviolacea TaxID=43657 RepID=A0A0C1QP84_9GAMM|nr:ATP-binding protein [Pseudoalteromonas luteoviolacea]KID56862.1 hypothetical protein JF50_13270 [Pseudoalteromonas luteoviolacea]
MRGLFFLFALVLSANCLSMQMKHLNTVAQDERQLMYFSSHDGVYRYDGEHFTSMSRFTQLPNGMVIDVQFMPELNYLIALYQNGELWKVNLNGYQATKVSDIGAYKLAVNNNSIFAMMDTQIVKVNVNNGLAHTIFNKDIKLFDIDSGYGHVYFLSEDGLYVYSELGVRKLENGRVHKGNLEATPHGVAYSINSTLYYYSNGQQSSIKNEDISSAENLTFIPPDQLYYTSAGNVSELNINTLKIKRKNIASQPMSYRNLFVDKSNTLWGVGINSFVRVDGQNKIADLHLDSQYNAIEYVNGEIWIGTSKGIYKYVNNEFIKVGWLIEKMPKMNYSINSFELFSGHLIVSTSLGAFKVNVAAKTVTRLIDSHVINASVIENSLYLATNSEGVKLFSSHFTQLDSSQYNNSLPSLEVLNVDRHSGKTYISTASGLIVADRSGNSILDFEQSVMVTDVAELNNELFLSTYGKGLFKKIDNTWQSVPSPSYIVELNVTREELFIKTTNGLHKVSNAHNYTIAIQGTLQDSFSTSSIKLVGDKLIAVSDKGLIEIPKSIDDKPIQPKIVFIESELGLLPEPEFLSLGDGKLKVAISSFDFVSEKKGTYQYSHNGSDWIQLDSAILTLSELKEKTHTLRFRYIQGNEISDVTEYMFEVIAPFYKSNAALAIYLLLTFILSISAFYLVYKWVQSFHSVYRRNQKHFQQSNVTEAYVNMVDAKSLCSSGNDTMLTEGLVKMAYIIEKLEPIAHDIASLGKQPLSAGINILQIHASMQLAMNVKIKSTVGDERFDNQLEHDIYLVLYHSVRNAIKHSRAKNVNASLILQHKTIEVCVEDDGRGITLLDKLNFGSGFYNMKQIAKVYKTKFSIKASKKGSTIRMVFPIIERNRPVGESSDNKKLIERI